MARQLALLFLRRLEVPVVLRDLDAGAGRRRRRLGRAGARAGSSPRAGCPSARRAFSRRSSPAGPATSVFAGCDLVLEAVFEELAVKQEVFAELERVVSAERVLATNTSSLSVTEMAAASPTRAPRRDALLQPGRSAAARRADPHARDRRRRRSRRPGSRRRGSASAPCSCGTRPAFVVNRVLTRMTTVLMDALEHGNTVAETDEAVLTPRAADGAVGAARHGRPEGGQPRARDPARRLPDRFPLSPTLANFAAATTRSSSRARAEDGRRDSRGVLEAIADEIAHMLDEGVVASAAEVDACLILGAGYPFFLGGITKHLDQTGVSERVLGRSWRIGRTGPERAETLRSARPAG